MSRLEGPTIRQYLIGGLFGNSPLLITLFALTLFDPYWVQDNLRMFNVVLSTTMLGGAALAAFYTSITVQRSRLSRVVVVGAVTGAFTFVVNYMLVILFFILFGFQFPPYYASNQSVDILRAALFIPGGIAGAFTRTRFQRVTRRRPPATGAEKSSN